ncbi:MAG: ATP-binding protein, partial [Synergistaceae bacterium]|nr:ATP-binding protein [Synergistaceae bacterium]
MKKCPIPAKFFNTAGPAQEDIHYTLDPLRRTDYEKISLLIDQRKYFVLHAPRQTGKTTSLLAMVKKINDEGRYHCVYMNVESAQTARNDVEAGIKTILSSLLSAVERFLGIVHPGGLIASIVEESTAHAALIRMLEGFCRKLDRPLVLFIDEIDALIGDTLVSVLRQLRDGYANRPKEFPVSVILCGMRDVRDYRIHMSNGEIVTGGSCFNVKAESLRLGDFSQGEIQELYEQHTAATGQVFEEGVYPKVWELTRGQPWLVNALAWQATSKLPEGRDRSRPITVDMIEEAANLLILERATHLDQLADKLREPRVRNVISPMVAGENWSQKERETPLPDDIQYVIDLGLIRNDGGNYVVANDIYREILPRELSYVMQVGMTSRPTQTWYLDRDGKLDMTKLLREFQQFFRENSESWLERFDYKEAGFQLLLQAFLQRIVNGGGLTDREYALGSGRVDLLVRWRYPNDAPRNEQREQKIVLELKTIRVSSHDPGGVFSKGLEQTTRYAEQSSAEEAHLVICDERP